MMKKIINIDSSLIKELRRRTDIGIMQCKQALIQANGDLELAIDNIRKFGLKIAEKKSKCKTLSGIVTTNITSNKKRGIMLEVNCETDFLSKENVFKEFVDTIARAALIDKIDSIDMLKVKFQNQRINLISKVGENINIRRFVVLTGMYIYCYTHVSKIGVIMSVSNNVVNVKLLKNIAMHIIAKNPSFIYMNEIPKDFIMHERLIQKEIAKSSGKSKNILEKIIDGRMNKFFDTVVLTRQNFILDENKTVGNILDTYNLQMYNFFRFEIGENSE